MLRIVPKIILLISIIGYLIGCALYYLIWYKNGQFLHIIIITLIVGGASGVIWLFKEHSISLKKSKLEETLILIFLIVSLIGFAGFVSSLERKRVDSIFKDLPKKQVAATVVSVDLRSTRSGKQPWSIINYNAEGQVIEQSFPDTSKNLAIGQKYLIEYSVKFPDMFRVLKKLE